jgi:hypothetical protein
VYWNTNRLYVRLHNFFVYLFINVFSQHVSVIYDHHQAVFTCTLTPVFYYSSLHWLMFTFGGKML